MTENTGCILAEMAERDRRFSALYHDAAKAFGLSEAAMWALYAAASSADPVSQRELAGSMGLSKQTVNSAVASLVEKGFAELRSVPGTRNRKNIVLTSAGKELASRTVVRMREAEARAVECLGEDTARLYIQLHDAFIDALVREFQQEGIRHDG